MDGRARPGDESLGLLDRRDDHRGRIDDGNRSKSGAIKRRAERRAAMQGGAARTKEASRVDREPGPVNVPT
jgi:hypothetical protein